MKTSQAVRYVDGVCWGGGEVMLWDDWIQTLFSKQGLLHHVPQDFQVLDGSQGWMVLGRQEHSGGTTKCVHIPLSRQVQDHREHIVDSQQPS